MNDISRIAISTGGGDAPGLNAVIRSATLAARNRGWSVVGVRDGFNGLLHGDEYPDGGLVELDRQSVRGIQHTGGTILGSTNRGNPTRYPVLQPDGSYVEVDRSAELIDRFREAGVDALITVGGDGSLTIGNHLHQAGLRVIGVPKTIDNDLDKTTATFGFDTAVSFATDCIDRLFTTATSHGRVMVAEVMGRDAGWIALHAGMAGGAHCILIPEIPYRIEPLAETILQRDRSGARFTIVVVAEGAVPVGGEPTIVGKAVGQAVQLGGVGAKVANEIAETTGKETRTVVLGHLLRGGSPTALDRLLGLRFGAAAVRALDEGEDGIMVGLQPPDVVYVPLAEATRRLKTVPLDGDTILTARDLGINFGDRMPGELLGK
ncbi:MAG TPA: ATP-dependent 6-phosphofructokinase [Ilumatobacteraceae bacterium]|nr:ATP-dependent 6-phosphofructokinase [Ilumatobacteraceae bacterium]